MEGTPNHFEKLLEGSCPNHAFPVKHLLKDYSLMRWFLSGGSNTSGAAVDPPASAGSWGTVIGPPAPASTSGVAVDPPTRDGAKDGPKVRPASSSGLMASPSLAWNRKGPYINEWAPISASSPPRSPHSMSATTLSSSSSSLSSLFVSSPRSHACCFCSFFFLLNSFVFLSTRPRYDSLPPQVGPSVAKPSYP